MTHVTSSEMAGRVRRLLASWEARQGADPIALVDCSAALGVAEFAVKEHETSNRLALEKTHMLTECSRLQERVRVLGAALRPFADRAADYDRPVDDPGYPIEPDYRPKEQRTRRLLIGDLRAARAALEGTEVE